MIMRAKFKLGYHPGASPKNMVSIDRAPKPNDRSPTPFGLEIKRWSPHFCRRWSRCRHASSVANRNLLKYSLIAGDGPSRSPLHKWLRNVRGRMPWLWQRRMHRYRMPNTARNYARQSSRRRSQSLFSSLAARSSARQPPRSCPTTPARIYRRNMTGSDDRCCDSRRELTPTRIELVASAATLKSI